MCCDRAYPRCDQCGKTHTTLFHGYCADCANLTVMKLRRLLNVEFSTQEQMILDDAYEGIALSEGKLATRFAP